VWDSIVEVRVERAEENQMSCCLGEGLSRGGGGTPVFKSFLQPGPVSVFPSWPRSGRVRGATFVGNADGDVVRAS